MRILKIAILLVALSSFTLPERPVVKKTVTGLAEARFRKIIISFSFNLDGCRHDLFAVIDTETGTGVGAITDKCPGDKPTRHSFLITRVNFTRQVTASDLSDFKDESGNTIIPSADEIQEIVTGINLNWPEE